jgi:hypothetical protein
MTRLPMPQRYPHSPLRGASVRRQAEAFCSLIAVAWETSSARRKSRRAPHRIGRASFPINRELMIFTLWVAGVSSLAVDDRRVRFRAAGGQRPGSGAQGIVDAPPSSSLAP